MKKETKQQRPAKPKSQKNLWVVVFKNGTVATWSLGYSKKGAIEKFLEGDDWIKDKDEFWREQVQKGSRCVKVNVSFEPVINKA